MLITDNEFIDFVFIDFVYNSIKHAGIDLKVRFFIIKVYDASL